MHGLINRAIERIARDTYGDAFWTSVTQSAGLEFAGFEAMLMYDHDITWNVLDALAEALNKSRDEVLEDLGTGLIARPRATCRSRSDVSSAGTPRIGSHDVFAFGAGG